MRPDANCRTFAEDSAAEEKRRLLLSRRDARRDYVEICSDHVSKAVLSLITLKLPQCFQ